ncbi:putative glutathione S-transferase 6 [Zancudomyces culisetae]|uniref:Putative glutathione S-transferase 6 n=1 Tax=Zancudomyces culisetae TaxID=1213189 RepID=A0A1R1PD34_ZANCU|nr:putative glutathione S-transferase 6 [Zancudomyces culisetae]|eukprot:OMH78819.1 putative glutathione S-transferase 6 [Zancudomyces culisetae]
MSSFELLYFPINNGRGTITRLMLNVGGANWKQTTPDWPATKENMPYGRLPVLIETCTDGSKFTLCESKVIERYVAHKFGFLPSDAKEAATAEQYVDNISDSLEAFVVHNFREKSDASKEKLVTAVKYLISKHEPILAANPSGHYIGNNLSYPDFAIYFLHFVLEQIGMGDLISDSTAPHMHKLIKKMSENPSIVSA